MLSQLWCRRQNAAHCQAAQKLLEEPEMQCTYPVHRGRHLATRRRPALSWFLLAKPSFVELFSPFVFSYFQKALGRRWA